MKILIIKFCVYANVRLSSVAVTTFSLLILPGYLLPVFLRRDTQVDSWVVILDVIIAPTQHQSSPAVLSIQIPRHLLGSKDPSNKDTPFRVNLDGRGSLSWRQQSESNTDRTIGLTFTSQNGFLEIFGTQIAHWLRKIIIDLLFLYHC